MIKELYNSEWNKEGEIINLLLFNKLFSEGISYFNVRNVHIVGTPPTSLERDQAIGRAIRYCSHKTLDLSKWTVTVYNYVTVLSEAEKESYLEMKEKEYLANAEKATRKTKKAVVAGKKGGGGHKGGATLRPRSSNSNVRCLIA